MQDERVTANRRPRLDAWALQRLYERREDRYVELLWPSFGVVHDLDDTRHNI